MLQNYLKTALRIFARRKGAAVLNIAGLTLGISSSLVLFLIVRHLATFDSDQVNAERIYRVVTHMTGNTDMFYTPGVPTSLPSAFRDEFPEAEEVTFLSYRSGALVRIPEAGAPPRKFQERRGVVFAEPTFFKVFDRPVLMGDPFKALDEPQEAIIARSWAMKYFGREDVIGETVMFDTLEYRISAVMEDPPARTDFPFYLMLSYSTIDENRDDWTSIWSDEQCYVLLKEGVNPALVEERIPQFVAKYVAQNYSDMSFSLQPLRTLHFDTRYSNFSYFVIPVEVLVALGVVALFLLLTACINFINISTAEAVTRSKEVGVRKVLGGSRRQLIAQFMGETFIVTALAMLLSLGIAQIALGFVNPFLDLELAIDFGSDGALWLYIVGVTVSVSVLSGIYPSLVMSGFTPASALKNKLTKRSAAGYSLRRTLVVLQLVISQFFIMGTIVLLGQMNYFRSYEMGFARDAIVIVPIPDEGRTGVTKARTLRDEMLRLSGVEAVSLGSRPPSSGSVNSTGFWFEGEDESAGRDTHVKSVDGHYLELYAIPLLAGRALADGDTATGFVVNEEFVRVSGMPDAEALLGRRINIWGKTLPVIGVVRDFHAVSLRRRIEPMVLMNNAQGYQTMSLKLASGEVRDAIDAVKVRWEETYPDHVFEYEFFDDTIREFYEGEEKLSTLLAVFTFLAIFIGCLGLFGLATFMTNQRTKEVGVRKALGATAPSIMFLFSLEYVRLIAVGFVIAAPASWYLMNKWLDTFAYRINIGASVFITGFATTLLVALITVGYKSFQAAVANPTKSLRYE